MNISEIQIQKVKPLSKTQRKYLAFIAVFHEIHGVPPTYKEAAAYFNHKHPTSSIRLFHVLADKGFISRIHGAPRGLEIHREKIGNLVDAELEFFRKESGRG